MLSMNSIKVIASFFPELEDKTSKEIEKSTNLSHEPVFRLLKHLTKDKYLLKKKVGKTNVYAPLLNDISHLAFTYFVTEQTIKFQENNSLLYKRLIEFVESIDCINVTLFGSYAKGTERKGSDIDLLVVSDKKGIENIAKTFKTKYNLTINPVVISPDDFKNIKKDNPTFYSDLIKFGIILYGIDFFFKEVYKNAKYSTMVY
jgi:predicted nucleotidyltransferase